MEVRGIQYAESLAGLTTLHTMGYCYVGEIKGCRSNCWVVYLGSVQGILDGSFHKTYPAYSRSRPLWAQDTLFENSQQSSLRLHSLKLDCLGDLTVAPGLNQLEALQYRQPASFTRISRNAPRKRSLTWMAHFP
jgi:hypothetical protein